MARRFAALCLSAGLLLAPRAHAGPSGSTQVEAEVRTTAPVLRARVSLVYPDAAGSEHGDVSVQVSIDAAGVVTEAEVVSGAEVFHAESLRAARKLRFDPALVGDTAVASTAVVSFHFAPPDEAEEGLEPFEEIVVHADPPDRSDPHARTTLGEAELERATGDDLATTLGQVSGVTRAGGTTATTSKPIIRGHSERRLLLLVDGVRHESQKWGPDHAPEIDPFSAGEITVIKGAAGARFGPDALGGVVLVRPPPLRRAQGVGGKAVVAGASNGRMGYAAARLDVAPADEGLTTRIEANVQRSASQQSPDYVLGNTASRQWNLGGVVGWQRGASELRLSVRHHDMTAGVFYGIQHGTPAEFEAQLEADRPVTADLWTVDYAIDRPFQAVTHDLVSLHGRHALSNAVWIEGIYAFQLNHREEYERARDDIVGPQYDFVLRTHSIDTVVHHEVHRARSPGFVGGVGLQGSFQENVYRGLSLIPNYRGFQGGAFAFERLTWPRLDLEVGGRYDRLSRAAFLPEADFEQNVRRGTLSDQVCDTSAERARCPRGYGAGSLTTGAVVHAVPDTVDLKVELSSASRFPNVDELFLIGSAPTLPVYALGAPDLGVETTWGASLTLGVDLPWLRGEVGGYGQRIDDFITFAPELGPDGLPRYDVTVRGAFPRYAYRPVEARFLGADGLVQLGPLEVVGLDLSGAVVRAREAGASSLLVGTPADRAQATAHLRPMPPGPARDLDLTVTVEAVDQQGRVDPVVDVAPPPDGYVLLHSGVSARFSLPRRDLRVGVEARNLTNTRYREYTSLLRYYADAPGLDVRARVAIDL